MKHSADVPALLVVICGTGVGGTGVFVGGTGVLVGGIGVLVGVGVDVLVGVGVTVGVHTGAPGTPPHGVGDGDGVGVTCTCSDNSSTKKVPHAYGAFQLIVTSLADHASIKSIVHICGNGQNAKPSLMPRIITGSKVDSTEFAPPDIHPGGASEKSGFNGPE